MSDTREALERSLFELRQAFDAAFAVPAEPSRKAPRGYLGIRLEDTPYALDLDGTQIEVLDVTDGIARLRLGGVCGGCPSSIMAAVMGLEEMLRRHVPEVRGIEASP